MKKKTLNLFIGVVMFVAVLSGGYVVYEHYDSETIKIANWNLQVFGQTKANNLGLMQIYSEIIEDYDIIFVQEIKGSTFFPQKFFNKLINYKYLLI